MEGGYTVGRDDDDDPISDESHAPGGGFYYLDSRTGEISQQPAAPDPGIYYRIVASDGDAAATFKAGEYPLVVPPKVMKLSRGERNQEIESLRREQYEDPGWLFEQNPDFEPGAPNRPVNPPTSQAPPYRDQDGLTPFDAARPGMDWSPPKDEELLSAPGPDAALTGPRRGSLADFAPAAMPSIVRQAQAPQLQRLPDALAKRIQALIGRRPGVPQAAAPGDLQGIV